MSCGGAAGTTQGSDGEPDNSTQPRTRGVKPATTFPQHRGGLQSVGPKPGWTASEAGGEQEGNILYAYACRGGGGGNGFLEKSIPCNGKLDKLSEHVMLCVELR